MDAWSDLWNPVTILGGAGALGLIVSRWRPTATGLSWLMLLALLLAGISGANRTHDALFRGTLALAIGWGTLWIVAHWPSPESKPADKSSTKTNRKEPLLLVLFAGILLTSLAGDLVTLIFGLLLNHVGVRVFREQPGEPTNGPHTRKQLAEFEVTEMLLMSLLLLGLTLLVSVTGSTRVTTIAEALQSSYVNHDAARYAIAGGGSRMLTLAIALIGSSLAGLMLAAPCHARLQELLSSMPPLSNTVELLLTRVAVLVVWLKLWPATIVGTESTAQLLAGVLASLTLVIPLWHAQREQFLARQWMWLALSQCGWTLMAVATNTFSAAASAEPSPLRLATEWARPTAVQTAWLGLLMDGLAVIGLASVLTYLRRHERSDLVLDDLHGLRHREPIAAGCATICLLSLIGVPFLAGFWPRLFGVLAAMNVRGEWGPPHLLMPHAGLWWLTVLAMLCSVWSLSIAWRAVSTMLFGFPLGEPRPAGTITTLFSAVLATLALLGCGLLPGPLLSWLCEP